MLGLIKPEVPVCVAVRTVPSPVSRVEAYRILAYISAVGTEMCLIEVLMPSVLRSSRYKHNRVSIYTTRLEGRLFCHCSSFIGRNLIGGRP